MSRTNSRGGIALVLAALLAIPCVAPGQSVIYPDAVSREVSSFNFGEPSAAVEAISRELSLFNFGQSSAAVEAISREVSLFNFGRPSAEVEAISREVSVFNLGQPSASFEALSREVSVLNFGEPSAVGEAISREVSVFNIGQPSAEVEAVSRELSVFNFGQPAAGVEALSREVSVFNVGQPSANAEAVSRELSVFNIGEFSASVEAISREVSILNIEGLTNQPPVILAQPVNQIVGAGRAGAFAVSAAGIPPLRYQWLFNETNILSDATNAVLMRTNVQAADIGSYRVVISNGFGAVTSAVATLSIIPCSPPMGLVAWWPEDGNGNDAIGANQPSEVNGINFIPARVGLGLSLSSGGYVDIRHSDRLALQRFTLTAWVRPDGPGPNNDNFGSVIIVKGIDNITDSAALTWVAVSGKFAFFFGDVFSELIVSSNSFPAGSFYLVHGTYDGTVFELYVNGQLEAQRTLAKAVTYNPAFPWTIGATPPSIRGQGFPRTWNGVLDEIAVFDRALTANEIAAIYAAGSTGMCQVSLPPLITAQPLSQTVTSSAPVTLNVGVSGTPPFIYQWFRNGVGIPGANNSTLFFSQVEPSAAGNYWIVVQNAFGAATSQVATLIVNVPPTITLQPQSRVVFAGDTVIFNVHAQGTLPMGFQWRRNGQPFITQVLNQTNASLTLFNVQSADSGTYQVVITNVANPAPGVPSAVATLTVFAPLTFGARPLSTNVTVGSTAIFCVDASGTPPVLYQWRHNGANIEGATNACLSITNVQPADGGTYHVVIENVTGTLVSDDAMLRIIAPSAPPGDNFVNRVSLGNGNLGLVSGTNSFATKELNEPEHADKPGGRSVWYAWIAPTNGIATFRTVGSSFDTLLAVYTGTSVSALTNVASDEDGGGFFTSELQFTARAGMAYPIAIDGFKGASGEFLLSWNLEITAEALPVVTQQPASRTVLENASAPFTVIASGSGLTYQWFFNGTPLSGQTGSTLLVANVRPEQVGFYSVRVRNSSGRAVQSDDAILEIGPEPEVQSQDKFGDSLLAGGAGGNLRGTGTKVAGAGGFLSLSAGLPIALVINNTNSTTERFEPSDCRIDGASRWLTVHAAESGTCVIDTIGSQVNTVLGVYTGSNYLTLQPVACDDDGAPDGIRSLVRFAATQGRQYRVRVDGVKARQGIIRVNAKLGHAPVVDATEPTNAAVKLGDIVQLHAPVSTDPMTVYEWRRDGTSLAGSTAPVLEIPLLSPTDAGTYSVVRANQFGRATNIVATLTLHLSYLQPALAVAGEHYRLVLQRPMHQALLIESSDDLVHWTPRHTVPLTTAGPTIEFPVTNSRTFFRARPWP